MRLINLCLSCLCRTLPSPGGEKENEASTSHFLKIALAEAGYKSVSDIAEYSAEDLSIGLHP